MKTIYKTILSLTLVLLISFQTKAQGYDKPVDSYEEIEETQQRIEDLYGEVYSIIDQYSNVTYSLEREDAATYDVDITGIEKNTDEERLRVLLIDLYELKRLITNMKNRVGVYYVTESSARPESGYATLTKSLQKSYKSPKGINEAQVDGTIYARFIVNKDGSLGEVFTSSDIEGLSQKNITKLEEEIERILTVNSESWTAASIQGVPVSEWLVMPFQFSADNKLAIPVFDLID